ncbi:MAG TPA: ThiF family adenylyltransferase, partial [Armatimonadota bacterium]|nr:ThiF family adenylyltransferase [Armatimonadota bacterium]
LGSPIAMYLAAAGVGTLGIVDSDTVDVTNLQRQIIHRTDRVGMAKVSSAVEAVSALNPLVHVQPLTIRLNSDNACNIIDEYDVVVDGTDNFPTRYLLNDACGLSKKPLIFGSIFRFEGQATVFHSQQGPCYRCLFPDPPPPGSVPTCAEGGVIGVLPGLIGMIQATETLKLIIGQGEPLIGRLLMVDALTMRFREINIPKNPDCPLCGDTPTITGLTDYDAFCGFQPKMPIDDEWELTPETLQKKMAQGTVRLIDVREEWEVEQESGLPNTTNLPFTAFSRRMTELDSSDDIVLYCTTGARSWQLIGMLRNAGFSRSWSLRGGLMALKQYRHLSNTVS